MKLGNKQKAYGLVLGLAVTGFVVDRLFFTPAESAAANVPAAHAAVPIAGESEPALSATPVPVDAQAPAGWLAERLRAAAPASSSDKNDLRDVFAVPASWRPVAKSVPAAAPSAGKPQLLGEQFRRDHHLMAVMIEGRQGRAVVDGQLVPLGGAVAGFRLVRIDPRSARFTHGDEQVSLTLAESDAAPVR